MTQTKNQKNILGELKMTESIFKKALAEALGTFILVFMGCGAIMVNGYSQGALGHIGISLVFGLSVATAIFCVGKISGAHINPAVTLGLALTGKHAWSKVPTYILAQISGALLASLSLKIILPQGLGLGLTLPSLSASQAFGVELILTAFLMFVILSVVSDENSDTKFAAISIGSAIAICAFIGGPLTGASMNPARSFAPALVMGNFSMLWLYVAAPIAGAILGALVFKTIKSSVPRGSKI